MANGDIKILVCQKHSYPEGKENSACRKERESWKVSWKPVVKMNKVFLYDNKVRPTGWSGSLIFSAFEMMDLLWLWAGTGLWPWVYFGTWVLFTTTQNWGWSLLLWTLKSHKTIQPVLVAQAQLSVKEKFSVRRVPDHIVVINWCWWLVVVQKVKQEKRKFICFKPV